jgi:superfamily II DNA/RNA helicase
MRVLDECDEMLNMGFQEDVETILGAAPAGAPVQTFLFSATMPPWVKELTRKYLRPDSQNVDLVGSDKMKASRSVEHKVLYCHWTQRASIVQDLVKCYGFSGAPPPRPSPVYAAGPSTCGPPLPAAMWAAQHDVLPASGASCSRPGLACMTQRARSYLIYTHARTVLP